METTKRFDEAVNKLYKAFNEGTLNAYDCTACAVGNLCNNQDNWAMHLKSGKILKEDSWYNPPKHKDYSEEELSSIEYIFLRAFDFGTENPSNKQAQFKGLMAVINYLAELDNIEVPQITVEQFKTVLTEA